MALISDTQPKDWKYVSEGGATAVFSYNGPANPLFDGMVLRLRKTVLGKPTPVMPLLHPEPDDPMVEFQNKCMERLIPPVHLPRLESIHLDQVWLKALADVHDVDRPWERRQKDQIDSTRQKGVLATDLVGGDWIAVEIKPKWAFLPSSKHLSESTRHVKTQTCRFCMHSRMRQDMGEATAVGYCPLDLFSGDPNRMTKAIYGLWDAWQASGGTVNNLKIFVDGKTIQPTEESRILASHVSAENPSTNDVRESFASALLSVFKGTPVLRLISNLQRTLDVLDIEGLSQLWRDIEVSQYLASSPLQGELPTHSPIGVSSSFLAFPEPSISDWNHFLDNYISSNGIGPEYTAPSPEILRHYVLAYLLSATFKDCSLIIRLDPLRPGISPTNIRPERMMVIDLDPKGVERLRKWERMDWEIADYNVGLEPKQCIDSSR